MKRSRLSLALLTAVWSPSLAPTSAQSTVSVYVPGYRSENWEDLAASVITSDSTATTYTIFCPNTDDCEISGPFPFTFAEGPGTFKYSATVESKLIAIISCELASTTAATCTEYSSFGAGVTAQNATGPTEVSRTETYSGSEVQWGVLTLSSDVPASATASPTSNGDNSGGGGGVETINPTDTAWFFPSATSESGAAAASWGGCDGRVVVGLVTVVVGVGLFGG